MTVRVGEHQPPSHDRSEPVKSVCALMLTHERTGLLIQTVESFLATTEDLCLVVFDDGSESRAKQEELRRTEGMGASVVWMPHRGFLNSWHEILKRAGDDERHTDFVLLEDDLLFADGWYQTLLDMRQGVMDVGLKPGLMSCFRPHETVQSKLRSLRGVMAYQSMAHGFQVNLIPGSVLRQRFDVVEMAVNEARRKQHGLDVYLPGMLAHVLGRVSFVTEQSWVAHVGMSDSLVEAQGWRSFKGAGYNLVPQLRGN